MYHKVPSKIFRPFLHSDLADLFILESAYNIETGEDYYKLSLKAEITFTISSENKEITKENLLRIILPEKEKEIIQLAREISENSW